MRKADSCGQARDVAAPHLPTYHLTSTNLYNLLRPARKPFSFPDPHPCHSHHSFRLYHQPWPMSLTSFPFVELPVELQDHVLSFLDYPNLINILTVNKYFHHLAKDQSLLRDPEVQIQFLLQQEEALENTNAPFSATFPGDNWRWPNHSPRKSYICFFCKKLKPLRKFAHGQCYRMTIDQNYSQTRKRWCLECGVKDLTPKEGGQGGRKYIPGAMINSVDHGYKLHLCGGCGLWSREFFCMNDKLCFPCTERDLKEPEKFVRGYQKEPRIQGSSNICTLDDELLKLCGVWEELLARFRIDEETWPRLPPCCRKCGGMWRFHPDAFGWKYEPELQRRPNTKRPTIWRHGYKISGHAVQEITYHGKPYVAEEYMSFYCPFPNQSWTNRLDSTLYRDIWDTILETSASAPHEVLD